jgi:hypothetical protein
MKAVGAGIPARLGADIFVVESELRSQMLRHFWVTTRRTADTALPQVSGRHSGVGPGHCKKRISENDCTSNFLPKCEGSTTVTTLSVRLVTSGRESSHFRETSGPREARHTCRSQPRCMHLDWSSHDQQHSKWPTPMSTTKQHARQCSGCENAGNTRE